ncbi:MAG TPA: hypothetical protein PKA20_01560 [Burkholderiaceae bacterium]|nr:hypothetical protein [Burkholderiaceae bacterium]
MDAAMASDAREESFKDFFSAVTGGFTPYDGHFRLPPTDCPTFFPSRGLGDEGRDGMGGAFMIVNDQWPFEFFIVTLPSICKPSMNIDPTQQERPDAAER